MTDQTCWKLREKILADFLQSQITFGKYRGETWGTILDTNPSYIVWADDNVEWLSIPPEIVTQARANNSAKRGPKRPYFCPDDYYEEKGFYDPYEGLTYGDFY